MATTAISLRQVLSLVGPLDDAPGDATPRERFRHHLSESVSDVGTVRDYIEECLRNSGTNLNRALQDLVNHLGTFLGFEVHYGRYQGVSGQIGNDGLWRSPSGLDIVVEIKTTDAYAIRTATLMGYISDLISAQEIPSRQDALGLYVVGRADSELRQLENAIAAEGRNDELRIISVAYLLDLADLVREYDLSHDDVLTLIKPSGPRVDPVVDLLSRLVGESAKHETSVEYPEETPSPTRAIQDSAPDSSLSDSAPSDGASSNSEQAAYWISPVRDTEAQSAQECVQNLVGEHQIYAYGDRTPGRKVLKPGDWICFYASGTGVVAHAEVSSYPERKPSRYVSDSERYPWVFAVRSVSLYPERPIVIDAALRARLDAFQGRDPQASWSWLVQGTRSIDRHDFGLLTGQESERQGSVPSVA